MRTQYFFSILVFSTLILGCKEDFLQEVPQAVLSDETLNTKESIEGLVNSAYASLSNDHYTAPHMLWPYGDLRSGDAYKGGDGPADIATYHAMEIFTTLQADMSTYAPSTLGDINNKKWARQYIFISRINNALRRLSNYKGADYPEREKRIAELRFLRGYLYFDLKILYKYIPYITEEYTVEQIEKLGNRDFSDNELWTKIAEEFKYASEVLPSSNVDKGRPNKWIAKSLLAKTLLYQAYKQNETHQVISIDAENLKQVVKLVGEVEGSGIYGLESDFANPFLYAHENGKEAVWQIQRSHNDGTSIGNLDFSSMLSYPMNSAYGCCGFHTPTQNLVNSFKTDLNGLPVENFNNSDLDLLSDFVDPRLDHTVAQPGKPFKYEQSLIYKTDTWARQPGIYGPYSSLKEVESPNCGCFEKIPPFMSSSKNTIITRFSDLLLWKAEALIELNQVQEGVNIINNIRIRASNSTSLLKDNTQKFLSKYKIGLYGSLSKDEARKALRRERRLELAMEGHRFFDLVRWGIAAEYVNEYLNSEKQRRDHLKDAKFNKGQHEYLPIPQIQINLSNGTYKQNIGY